MALYNPMPPACRAGARLHLGDSPSLEEPEARGLLQNEKEIRGVGWRGIRDSNPETHPLSFGIYPDLPSREPIPTSVLPDDWGPRVHHMHQIQHGRSAD